MVLTVSRSKRGVVPDRGATMSTTGWPLRRVSVVASSVNRLKRRSSQKGLSISMRSKDRDVHAFHINRGDAEDRLFVVLAQAVHQVVPAATRWASGNWAMGRAGLL